MVPIQNAPLAPTGVRLLLLAEMDRNWSGAGDENLNSQAWGVDNFDGHFLCLGLASSGQIPRMNASRKSVFLFGFMQTQELRQKNEKKLFARANKRYI